MRRALRLAAGLAAGAAGLALLWVFWPVSPLPARWGPEDCRRLALLDAETGAPILGVEDIARLADGALLLSAHDRLAAATGGGEGGLYRLPPGALAGNGPLRLEAVLRGHPHGIDAQGGRIAVILREHGGEGHDRTDIVLLERAGGRLLPVRRWEGPWLCAANDVALAEGTLWVSLDRRDCPGLSARDALGSGGSVVRVDLETGARETVARGLAFANGLVAARGPAAHPADGAQLAERPSGEVDADVPGPPIPAGVTVAETRGARLRHLPGGGRTPLPGGPDNLTRGPEGGIVAAVHPSMLRLALHRHGHALGAPSRILSVGVNRVRVLFDDPAGALWPGATVAVAGPEGFVAGAVRAPGLLVCGDGA